MMQDEIYLDGLPGYPEPKRQPCDVCGCGEYGQIHGFYLCDPCLGELEDYMVTNEKLRPNPAIFDLVTARKLAGKPINPETFRRGRVVALLERPRRGKEVAGPPHSMIGDEIAQAPPGFDCIGAAPVHGGFMPGVPDVDMLFARAEAVIGALAGAKMWRLKVRIAADYMARNPKAVPGAAAEFAEGLVRALQPPEARNP